MTITRRTFLGTTAAALAATALTPGTPGFPGTSRVLGADAAAAPTGLRIRGIGGRVSLETAKAAGLDGAELSMGGAAEKLQLADPKVREGLKAKMKETGVVVSSLSMDLLNGYPLASDERGGAWLEQTIDAAQDLGCRPILMAFFGKGSLGDARNAKKADIDAVVARLKVAAPRAKAAGVCLGLENTLNATQNLEIMDRVGSDAVQSWYDVGNLTNAGYDVPAEIRQLKGRICCFHFKDGNNYLGEGKVKFDPIAAAMKDIGYQGWIVLETSSPSKDVAADARKNADFIRKLFGMA